MDQEGEAVEFDVLRLVFTAPLVFDVGLLLTVGVNDERCFLYSEHVQYMDIKLYA